MGEGVMSEGTVGVMSEGTVGEGVAVGPLAPSDVAFRLMADRMADMLELEPHLARDAYDLVSSGAWPSQYAAAWEEVLTSGHEHVVLVLRGSAGDRDLLSDSPFHALGLVSGELRLAVLHAAYASDV